VCRLCVGMFESQLAVELYFGTGLLAVTNASATSVVYQEAVYFGGIRYVIAKPLLGGKLSFFVFC